MSKFNQGSDVPSLAAQSRTRRETRRLERANRRERREYMAQQGLKATREQCVYRVQCEKLAIPEWAERHALPNLPREGRVIWVKQRKTAKILVQLDRCAGGQTDLQEVEARRCPLCKTWLLG
jgi:hypothetical protein